MAITIIYSIFGGSGYVIAILALIGIGYHNLFWNEHAPYGLRLQGQGNAEPGQGADGGSDGTRGQARGLSHFKLSGVAVIRVHRHPVPVTAP